MSQVFVVSACVLCLAATSARAQDKFGNAGKPAGIEKLEIVKPLPKDVKSLRDDAGGGTVLGKQKPDKPILEKNVNSGQGGGKEVYQKPVGASTKALTTGASGSGPGDDFKKKQKVLPGKNTRGSSDEGGDLEDLEIQR